VLLIGENPQGSSNLANRLRGCEFALSYQEAGSLVMSQDFFA